jgi:endonuclease/exonuclease/phosphatase (EEP) superfamily protein YafD
MLGWLAVLPAAGMVGLSFLWTDDLAEAGRGVLAVHYLAFMSATFLFQAGVGMGAVLGFALLTIRWRLALAAALLAGLSAGPEMVGVVRARLMAPPSIAAGTPTLTVMSANLLYSRADPERFVAEVSRHQPDVIVFQEWTARSVHAIKPLLLSDYPHWIDAQRDDAFGQAVGSKRPFTRPVRIFPTVSGWHEPQVTVAVELDGHEIGITNVHLPPPVNMSGFREQRRTAALLATVSAQRGAEPPQTDIVAGDFNAVPRSVVIATMRQAGLTEAIGSSPSSGRLRGTTWPRIGTPSLAPGIRIDHVLFGPRLRCIGTTVCGDVGSDHSPIVARFVLATP